MGASAVLDHHGVRWPDRAGGSFDGAVVAQAGLRAAMALMRDGGVLCSITSDAPPEQRDIRRANLYVAPNGAQLEELADLAAAGQLEVNRQPVELPDAPDSFARLTANANRRAKLVPTS